MKKLVFISILISVIFVIANFFGFAQAAPENDVSSDEYLFLPMVFNHFMISNFGDLIKSIPSPASGSQGLAWDGANLWVAWGQIYKINPSNGSVISQIPYPAGDIQDLTWDGSSLWCVSYQTDQIYKLNPATGAVLSSFASPNTKPIGIAWDGTYLWHSDENGFFYKLNPTNGSVVSTYSSPFGNDTTLLEWDGQYLWASGGDEYTQFDTYDWRVMRTIKTLAAFSKGIAWDGQNIWNGGFNDETLYLIDATPARGTISGTVMKSGSPISNKPLYLFKNSNESNEMQVGFTKTSPTGEFSFIVDPGVEYELRGFADQTNNEFRQFNYVTIPSYNSPNVVLPDIDIWYSGLSAPADGASFNRDTINSSNPIAFNWTSKTGASYYSVNVRQHHHWSYRIWRYPDTTALSADFDGTTTTGIHLPAIDYDWMVGMSFDNGWWCWSGYRSFSATSTALTITIDGNPSDWSAAEPLATDAVGDNTGGTAGTDLGSIYSYVDGSDVYLLVEVHDPNLENSSTIELNLDYKPGKYTDKESTADLHTNIRISGISAWSGDFVPYPIVGAQVAFGQAMEIRIPRSQLENTTYAIPTFVNIWVSGTGRDLLRLVP